MVAAAKAHKLAQKQQAQRQVARQVAADDANRLLEMFGEKMTEGLPDEALRLASTAVDLFFRDGDKDGESRALSYVAQAMAAGATLQKSDGFAGAPVFLSEMGGMQNQEKNEASSMYAEGEMSNKEYAQQDSIAAWREDFYEDDQVMEDFESSLALTDLTQLPISYGERLILETCMRCRNRPYDRQRQEQLSQPRRRHDESAERSAISGGLSGDPTQSGGVSQETKLSLAQEAQLVSRLAAPRRRKHTARPPGEQIMLRNKERETKLKQGGLDIGAITARLSKPRATRALSPTPGERVVLMWNRSENLRKPDLNRINELAKASRRGASARAWGVTMRPFSASEPPRAPMPPVGPAPPESARGPPRRVKEAASSYEGSPESGLPPLETPESPQASQKRGPPSDARLPDTSQASTWNHYHPWRAAGDKSGVDRHA